MGSGPADPLSKHTLSPDATSFPLHAKAYVIDRFEQSHPLVYGLN